MANFGNIGGTVTLPNGSGDLTPQLLQSMKRRAQLGSAGVNRLSQIPFNPQIQNLDIPQGYGARNDYKRHFFKTNPIVGNAIELHSEFPLSDFHLEHEDGAIEEFLNDMLQEANFFEHMLMTAVEWWLIGEANSFAFFDDTDNPACYTNFVLLDPSKLMIVSNNMVQGHQKETVQLTFDTAFHKIVDNGPNDRVTGELYRHLPSDMIAYCKTRQPMPLSPLQVSRLKRGGYFSQRGESALERVFPLLMLKDELRTMQRAIAKRAINPVELWKIGETGEPADQTEIESFRELLQATYYDIGACFHPSHECLTRSGWKNYLELTMADEIGTINVVTGALEYQLPTALHVNEFAGELIHFCRGYNDILVTPNHRMLVDTMKTTGYKTNTSKLTGKKYRSALREFTNDWKFVFAESVEPLSRFRGVPDSWQGVSPEFVFVGQYPVPTATYCRFAGYFVSEGFTAIAKVPARTKRRQLIDMHDTGICQKAYSPHIEDFDDAAREFAKYVPLTRREVKSTQNVSWNSYRKEVFDHFRSNFGTHAPTKQLPEFLLRFKAEHLKLVLVAANNGDGTQLFAAAEPDREYAGMYGTTSLKLLGQIQEICFKLGYPSSSRLSVKAGTVNPYGPQGTPIVAQYDQYIAYFNYPEASKQIGGAKGRFPYVGDYNSWPDSVKRVPYNGKTWCVSVPNETVVTRRNGRISVSGNSLVWHHAVNCQVIGAEGRMPQLWSEFDAIDAEVCAGLLINKGLILGDSSTFASDVMRMDILINRYLMFRTKIEHWILHDILSPILKIHEMYVPESKVKSMRYREMCGKGRPLSYPKIRWEKQSLRDEAAKLDLLTKLVEKKLVPESTLIRMLNIDPRTAADKVEKESMDKIDRHQKMLKQLKDKGLSMTPEIAQILGFEAQEPSGMPGAGGGGGIPTSIGGGGEPMPAMPDENSQLPEVVPGADPGGPGGQTAGIPKQEGVQGAPAESQMPVGLPGG